MPSLRSLLSAQLLVLLLIQPAAADGKFIPAKLVQPVKIPTQSAAISFSEGKEVLTIWNTIQTSAGETAWVLPLPAKPDVIQKSSPEAFRLLEILCAPEVQTRRPYSDRPDALEFAVFCTFWGALLLLWPRQATSTSGLKRLVVWLATGGLMLLYAGLISRPLIPKFGSSGPEISVKVLDSQPVGAYETTVLSTTGAGPLNEWLKTGGFPEFTGAELAVVDDYAAKGWVFLCARMKLEDGKPVHSPHPLTVRFPTDDVIYPMRLTAGSGPAVDVRVFVVSTEPWRDRSGRLKPFVHAPLKSRLADRLRLYSTPIRMGYVGDTSYRNEYDKAERISPDLLHDALVDSSLYDEIEGTVSLLTGTFRHDSDWSDVVLEWTEEQATPLPHVSSRLLASEQFERAVFVSGPMFLGLCLLARIFIRRRDGGPVSWRASLTIISICVAVFISLRLQPTRDLRKLVAVPSFAVSAGRTASSDAYKAYQKWLEEIRTQPPSAR